MKETLAEVFSWEFCKMFKNTFFAEHLSTTASLQWFLRVGNIWGLQLLGCFIYYFLKQYIKFIPVSIANYIWQNLLQSLTEAATRGVIWKKVWSTVILRRLLKCCDATISRYIHSWSWLYSLKNAGSLVVNVIHLKIYQ